MSWTRQIPFQVDIAGVIEILGTALYSRPESALRELIQNAHDAVLRRRRADLNYVGRIDVVQDGPGRTIRFSDDGVGITASEAETYLSTLGIGMTGRIRGRGDLVPPGARAEHDDGGLIGMFGVGLFSAFMLADRVVIESRQAGAAEGVRWAAGAGSHVELSSCPRDQVGTTVALDLKPEHHRLATDPDFLEKLLKEYADFVPVPIYLNDGKARVNLIHPTWFDPTPDAEAIELELASYFNETPLDVISVRSAQPALAGALYVTSERTPGFAGESVVTATVRRMVISRQIQRLLPTWAPFLRGILELDDCTPTLSREDLVRDAAFEAARARLETLIFDHLEHLASTDRVRFDSVLTWHRYTLAGSALTVRRLRDLLRWTYPFPTSRGPLTFAAILDQSEADPLVETDAERVIWYNTDRRQEGWANTLFAGHPTPCVHALRSFEESLLATLAADSTAAGTATDLRLASPGSPGFAMTILGVSDLEDAPATWQEFLGTDARILCASFRADRPVMAFLNERSELTKTLEDLRSQGTIPTGFQRMIDAHVAAHPSGRNEVLLNRDHRLVARALVQSTRVPLASALRLLVGQALAAAGAAPTRPALRQQGEDLDWIADALWGRDA